MALVKTQDNALVPTDNIAYTEITSVKRETGMVELRAYYPSSSQDYGLHISLFSGPQAQAIEVSEAIGEKWFTDEIYEVPEPRMLTLEEEQSIFNSIHVDKRRKLHIYQELGYNQVIIRHKSNIAKFNVRIDHTDKDEAIVNYLESIGIADTTDRANILNKIKVGIS